MNGKSKVWALALLLGVLLLGGAVGAFADRLVLDEPACPRASFGRSRARDGRSHHLDWLAQELDLSAAQRARVEQTVERHRERVSALWRELRPQFEQMQAELRGEIRDVLTEEQRTAYEELLKSEKRRRHPRKRRDG